MDSFLRSLTVRAARHAPLIEGLIAFAVVLVVWGPFLASTRVDDKSLDWTFRTDYVGYGLNALFHDHEFPFWVTDPRFEQLRAQGIHDFFANPETDVLSTITPLAKWWGLLTAVKVSLALHLGLGVWGCRRLLVALAGGATLVSLVLASLLVLCNGAIVAHILHGHIQFLAMASFPLALSLIVDAFDPALAAARRRFRAGAAGGMLALDYYSGATHPLFYFLLCFVALLPAFTVLFSPRRWRVVFPAAALVGVSFVVLAAFKLLPGLVDFSHYRRNYFLAYDGWREFASNFVIPWVPIPGHQLQHETNIYVGWLGVLLLAFAVAGLRAASTRALLLSGVALSWLMFLPEDSPLLKLPLLRTQGAPTRLRFLLIMAVAVVAVAQIERLLAWTRRSRGRAVRLSVMAIAGGAAAFLAFDLSRTNVARHVAIGCLEAQPEMKGPFDLAPEMTVVLERRASVRTARVTANKFVYDFSGARPGTVIVAPSLGSDPFAPHLRLVGDGVLTTQGGPLAVVVGKERGQFALEFHDPRVAWGLCISIFGVLGLIAMGVRLRVAPSPRAQRAPVWSRPSP